MFFCITPCAVPAEQEFATCASTGGEMQTTFLATTATNRQTTAAANPLSTHQTAADSLDIVSTITVCRLHNSDSDCACGSDHSNTLLETHLRKKVQGA